MKQENKIDFSFLNNVREDSIRIPVLFLRIQKSLEENRISVEERKVLARMLNAYYNI